MLTHFGQPVNKFTGWTSSQTLLMNVGKYVQRLWFTNLFTPVRGYGEALLGVQGMGKIADKQPLPLEQIFNIHRFHI